MKRITTEHAVQLIRSSGNKIFSVSFVKKDGSSRLMNCRLGVTKHLKGGELAYDPKEYGLIAVFDIQKNNYRMINLETIQELSINGDKFQVV